MHAELGNKPSYIWRSISQAIPLLHEGILWRVGDGTQIQIRKDRWLPRDVSCKMQSTISVLPKNAVVANLIDTKKGWWNLDLLHSIFNDTDVEAILKIPISLQGCADRLLWRDSSNGCFSVKVPTICKTSY